MPVPEKSAGLGTESEERNELGQPSKATKSGISDETKLYLRKSRAGKVIGRPINIQQREAPDKQISNREV